MVALPPCIGRRVLIVNEHSISTVLGRLEDRLRSFERYRRATERLNDQFGVEDREEWRAHAPDQSKREDPDE